MEISSKLNQYSLNKGAGVQSPTPVKVAQNRMVSTLGDMKPGYIFEGTVSELRGGQAKIALGSGQALTARIGGNVNISQGDTLFFQVKSNDDNQIYIRPYTAGGQSINPILYNALESANLPINADNLQMVDAMMQEGMSIDKQSLTSMSHVISGNSGAEVFALVQMQKLSLPITVENYTQFINYKNNEQAILSELSVVTDGLSSIFSSEDNPLDQLLNFNSQIAQMLDENVGNNITNNPVNINSEAQEAANVNYDLTNMTKEGSITIENTLISNTNETSETIPSLNENIVNVNDKGQIITTNAQGESIILGEQINEQKDGVSVTITGLSASTNDSGENGMQNIASGNSNVTDQMPNASQNADVTQTDASKASIDSITYDNGSAGAALKEEGIRNFSAMLNEIKSLIGDSNLLENGMLKSSYTSTEVIKELSILIEQAGDLSNESISHSLSKLLKSNEYQTLLKDAMLNQWTLSPQSVKEKQNVDHLYERILDQMNKLQSAAASVSGQGAENTANAAKNVASNLEFINQINQIYNYVQIPVKMWNKDVNSELYVYTNKKELNDKDAPLSALLHLDMENLGPIDVMVKLQAKNVYTDFSMSDDKSFELIMNNIDILENKLNKLGYTCEVTVKNTVEKQDFVKDFLERDESVGTIKRYSFDMKA